MRFRNVARRLVREPLIHFALVGAVLFGVSAMRAPNMPPPEEIIVTEGEIENLTTLFARTWQRPPTKEELDGLIAARVREEVLYREALALGLDAGDVVVRRRLVQKLEFLSDDLAARHDPSDAELQAWLDNNAADHAMPARITFRQVFLNPDRRGELLDAAARDVLAQLDRGSDFGALGDPTLLPSDVKDEPLPRVAQTFGEAFAAALAEAQPGAWIGPLQSTYGVHLVHIDALQQGKSAKLEAVRDAVLRDWRDAQRRKAQRAMYETMRAKYTVTIAGRDIPAP